MKKINELMKWLVSFLMTTLLFISCDKADVVEPVVKDEKEAPKVYVLGDKQREIVSVSDDDIVTLKGSFSENDFPVGSIIVSGVTENAPQGFLYKVVSVKANNGQTIISTTQASLAEAIQEGSAREEIDLMSHISKIYDSEGNEISLEKTRATGDMAMTLPVDFTLDAKKGDNYSVKGELKLKGELEIKATFCFDLEFDDGLDRFEMWGQPQVKFNLTAEGDIDAKAKFKKKLYSVDMEPYTIFVGGWFPLVVTPHMDFVIFFEIDGKIGIKAELFKLDFGYKVGFKYDDGWDIIDENTGKGVTFLDNFKKGTDVEATVKFESKLKSILIPDLYNLRKVTESVSSGVEVISLEDDFKEEEKSELQVEVAPVATFKVSDLNLIKIFSGEESVNPKIKTTIGVEAAGSAVLTLFDKKIINFKPKSTLAEWILCDCHLFPTLSDISILEDKGNSIKIRYFIENVDDSFFESWKYGLAWNEAPMLSGNDNFHHKELGKVDFDEIGKYTKSVGQQDEDPIYRTLSVKKVSGSSSDFITRGSNNTYEVIGEIVNLTARKPYIFKPYIQLNLFDYKRYGEPVYLTAGLSTMPVTKDPLTFTSTGTTTISMEGQTALSLEYNLNDTGWKTYSLGHKITLSNNHYVSFRAGANGNSSFSGYKSGGFSVDSDELTHFVMSGSGKIAASGNIMSLLDADCHRTSVPSKYCFVYMFKNCIPLTSAPKLPATELIEGCYGFMFYGCTSLTSAPEVLPATKLALNCYQGMFRKCTSLSTAPELPATSLVYGCYLYMFDGCTSLTTAPILPATTLAPHCYQMMFDGCTSLETAPVLPATTLEDACYNAMFSGCTSLYAAPKLPATSLAEACYMSMFWNCTSLTTASVLPATTLADQCYMSMFHGCTSLRNAPVLPATKLAVECYNGMFSGCSSLNYVKALFVDYDADSENLNYWLLGVNKSGLFVQNPNATYDPNAVGIPSGWTIEKNK